MYEEEAHQINLIHIIILLAILVIFGLWIIHRGLKKQFKDKTIYSRKESIPIKYEPAFIDCLYDVSVKDGSCIRAWMPEDKKQMLKKMKRDPLRKQQMKKKLEDDQKRKEAQKQREHLDDFAAAQLHGINFEKRLPYLGSRYNIDPNKPTGPPVINRSFQDYRHNQFMLRRHSSFLGAKQTREGVGGVSKFKRERNNSLTSERSCASGMQFRKSSISSLPFPEVGFQPQRTSSGVLVPPQASGSCSTSTQQSSSHLQVQSPTYFSAMSSPPYYSCASSDSDSHDWPHVASHEHRHGSMTGAALIDSSLQEVDEELVSSDEGTLPVVLIPDAPALLADRRRSRLDASNPNITQNNPSPTSSQYLPESNSFLKIAGSGILKVSSRRSSETYRDINSEIEEILNITESPRREIKSGVEASREGNAETDEDEEDPVAAEEEEDADFEETEGEGARSDESFLNTDKSFRESGKDHNRNKDLSVSFMSVTMADIERGAISSNNSPRSSHHKLFPRRSFRTSSFRTSKNTGSSSLSHKFRGSLSKLQLAKTFSLSSKATYQQEIGMEVIDRNDDCDNSKSSNRSSIDLSRRESKFQVEILPVPDDSESKTDTGEDDGGKFRGQNRLTPWLLSLPQQHRPNSGDVANPGTSQQGSSGGGGSRRRNDCSICSNDYPEEEGDTITSLKNVFTRNI